MKHFDEFKLVWEENFKQNRNKFPHLIFIAVYPDKLKWDFGVEKQTQTTCLQISGGMTGAGTGHDVKLLYQSELYEFLKTCTQTHAMIVTVGMVFEMTTTSTTINEFHKFSKSTKFCKAHIMARPNQSAWLHPQHIELNLDKWKKLDCPDLSRKNVWTEYVRAEQNYHDDYTPFWLKPKGIPRIHNFNIEERRNKSFSYGHMKERRLLQNETWEKLRLGKFNEVDHEDNYFSRLMTRMRTTYYLTNNEKLNLRFPEKKFNIIVCPTAGYTGEIISNNINFDGEVIFYDYTQQNIDIKQTIVEMNMSKSELKYYITNLPKLGQNVVNVNFDAGNFWDNIDYFRKLQLKMLENYDIDYWVMNLIEPDYDKLLKKVKGKRVYFNASNIFSYHVSHAMYTLDELIISYNKLHEILSNTESYYFRGSTPSKRWEYIYV
jgi:hypothetical protein